jgi:hypothetical protein
VPQYNTVSDIHKIIIQNELRINPPFLKRNFRNYKVLARRNFPNVTTCNIISIKEIECTNKKYTGCKILGYKYINDHKSTRISYKIDLSNKIDLKIINYSCYESTVLYFYLYTDKIIKKFSLRYNSCDTLDREYFRVFEDGECLLIKYSIENKKDLHYKPIILDIKECQTLEKLSGPEILKKNFCFISKHKNKIKLKQEDKLKTEMDNYIGYFLDTEADHPYRELMIKWNGFYIRSADFKGKKIDLIIEFMKKEAIPNKINFLYLFYSRQLISMKDMCEIKEACLPGRIDDQDR